MIQNTNCSKCLFANKASSDNPCEHGMIDHLKGIKRMKIVDDFYVIEEYACKMGFSKEVYEANKDSVTIEEIKREVVARSYVKYYLMLNLTDSNIEQITEMCDKIKAMDIKPSFVSFMIFPSSNNKEKIDTLKQVIGGAFDWKAHNFIESISIDDAIHMTLDTNFKKYDSNFILLYDINSINEINEDMNELNSDIIIDQKIHHYGRKNGTSGLQGLFLHFDNYQMLRSIDKDIMEAFKSMPEPTVLLYGSHAKA
jgi:hypothetical protein